MRLTHEIGRENLGHVSDTVLDLLLGRDTLRYVSGRLRKSSALTGEWMS